MRADWIHMVQQANSMSPVVALVAGFGLLYKKLESSKRYLEEYGDLSQSLYFYHEF